MINKYWNNKRTGSVGYLSGLPTTGQLLEWKDSDRSLSVLRDVAESKGATVTWNEADWSVTVTKGGSTLTVKIGEAQAVENGQPVPLPFEVRMDNDRAMIPTATLLSFLNK